MHRVPLRLALIGSCFLFPGLPAPAADDAPETTSAAPSRALPRVPWTTSQLRGTPDPPRPYTVRRVFPARKFRNPVFMAQEPGTSRLLVAELGGKVYAFDKHDASGESQELFLDVGRQIYAFAFHPRYAQNGQVVTFCPQSAHDNSLSSVSRWQTNLNGPRSCQADSEDVIIQWPSGGHNGGEAIFGPDGYLYISTGDGTGGSDPNATGQGVDDLFSVIMRLDVDQPDEGRGYSIPKDNPFLEIPNARPEIWAFGFRNPWRMSFDPESNRLYVGDVGQDLWEMIWDVRRGGNYGWSVREASHAFHPHKPSGPGPILPPIIEHSHIDCRSITGGYVYRGDKLPELQGAYLYGDYQYGKIWGLRYDGERVTWQMELADTALQIPAFALSRDGDFYVVDHLTGELFELVPAPPTAAVARFPRHLSETGLFADTAGHELAPGLVPYSVNTPQWLDGAMAERFFGLPENHTIHFVERSTDANTWGFADGSVTAQTIFWEDHQGDPKTRRRIETRVMVKQEDHWLGYSYVWNDSQTDAQLAPADGMDVRLPSELNPRLRGDSPNWRVPSRNECMVCHSRAAGFVLGLNTVQMNRQHAYGVRSENQLAALSEAGFFDTPLGKSPEELGRLPNAYDPTEELEPRARAYLHVNCSMCHVSDGGGNAQFQVRHDLALNELKLIDGRPLHGDFGLDQARLVTPGDPYSSVLFFRLSKTGPGRMPHVGSHSQDVAGLRLIHDWIASLPRDGMDPLDEPSWGQLRLELDESLNQASIPDASRSNRLLPKVSRALRISHALLTEEKTGSLREDLARVAIHDDRASIRDLFERFLPERERTQRLGEAFDPDQVLSRQGDPARGRTLFLADGVVQCKNCHGMPARQLDVGPDLSQIGSKYSRRQLLDAIANPSLQIDARYQTYVVETTSGKVITGILIDQNDEQIRIVTVEGSTSNPVSLPRTQIDQISGTPTSLMPQQLLRDLTAQQAADLIDFLASLRKPESGP